MVVAFDDGGRASRHYVVTAPGTQYPNDVVIAIDGSLVVTGSITNAVDFGGGARTVSTGAFFLLSLDISGMYQWDLTPTLGGSEGAALAVNSDRLVLGGDFTGTLDLPDGSLTADRRDGYVLVVTPFP
jgi:hypothetical protein